MFLPRLTSVFSPRCSRAWFVGVLALSASAAAAPPPAALSPSVSPPVTAETRAVSSSAAQSAAPAPRKARPATGKSGPSATAKGKDKRYSKATLSAFAPPPAALAAPQAASPAVAGLAVPATVSPVVVVDPGEGLRQRAPTPLTEQGRSGMKLQMKDAALLTTDPTEAKPVTPEATDESDAALAAAPDTSAMTNADEPPALGQEALSVIDRNTDKPKAQPIASGPVRVRVKDSGVRAMVQIPLEGTNP